MLQYMSVALKPVSCEYLADYKHPVLDYAVSGRATEAVRAAARAVPLLCASSRLTSAGVPLGSRSTRCTACRCGRPDSAGVPLLTGDHSSCGIRQGQASPPTVGLGGLPVYLPSSGRCSRRSRRLGVLGAVLATSWEGLPLSRS